MFNSQTSKLWIDKRAWDISHKIKVFIVFWMLWTSLFSSFDIRSLVTLRSLFRLPKCLYFKYIIALTYSQNAAISLNNLTIFSIGFFCRIYRRLPWRHVDDIIYLTLRWEHASTQSLQTRSGTRTPVSFLHGDSVLSHP